LVPPSKTLPARTFRQKVLGAAQMSRYFPATLKLVWEADRWNAVWLALMSTVQALLPAALAYVGKLIIDAVVHASQTQSPADARRVMELVLFELGMMVLMTALGRLSGLAQSLIRARLGNLINERILAKALRLDLQHFEDADIYDKMQNARREASGRPVNLVLGLLSIARTIVTLGAFAALLIRLSPWTVLLLLLASVPAFIAEARLSGEAFRLYSWRAPEGRRLNYLEWILTRDSHVKEVKLYDIGDLILGRYKTLFTKFFAEDRRLAMRRMGWGLSLGLVSVAAFYGSYLYIASQAATGDISLGDMTLYLVVFRQGQGALQDMLTSVGALYEDALFMSNLFVYLNIETSQDRALPVTANPPARGRSHGIEFRNVSFRYPGKKNWALKDFSLTLAPGEKLGLVGENGAGKSTLVKLLMRLYEPTEGVILYGGVDLRELDPVDLRTRVGAVFQDFVRYQFHAGENIGLGDLRHLEDRPHIEKAADRGGATSVIAELPQGLDTVLGGWFEAGQELSAGQWQKIAVARGFMREDAELLILDEPTASIDAAAEHELFNRFRRLSQDRMAIIISHRFSTVRIADRIAVLHEGQLTELGTHHQLLEKDGRYANLFRLQAKGYLD
jgi:ATP-binding cassette, subfamily B, bacterial